MTSNSAGAVAPPSPEDAFLHSLQGSSQSWKQFDLGAKKSSIETNLAQSKEYREATMAGRKKLSELTRSLKKAVKSSETAISAVSVDDDTVTALVSNVETLTKSCRTTIKSFQEEVDNLTRRCKASDATFMEFCKPMQDLPDPGLIIENASLHLDNKYGQIAHLLKGMEEIHKEMEDSKKNHELEISTLKAQQEQERVEMENKIKAKALEAQNTANNNSMSREEKEELIELRKEVAEYEVEFRSLKNQDITIKNLKATIENMTLEHDNKLRSELEKARDEISKTEGQRAAEALEREAATERRLESLELELRAERAGREATKTHLLEADEGASEREAAWEAQRQIILNDADRLREALHEVTREKNELSLQLESIKDSNLQSEKESIATDLSTDMVDYQLERKAYENEINELGITVSSLKEDLNAKDEKVIEIQSSLQATIDDLMKEQKVLKDSLNSTSKQLKLAPSLQEVEEMKRELVILKKLEYNAGDFDLDKISDNKENTEDDLETVLIAKLRKAESDLLKERREKVEQAKECEEMRKQLTIVEKEKAKADELASKLEIDLERVITSANETIENESENQSTFEEVPLATPSDPSTLQKIIDPTGPPLPSTLSSPDVSNIQPKRDKAKDHSVATIVMAQRDRLRNRCDVLEAETDGLKKELQMQVSVADTLKSDNTKLYEKIRYLQNYNSSKNSSRFYNGKSKGNMDDIDIEALDQKYEASVDPFRQFSRAERQRKINEMSSIERIVFIFSKTLLGNKTMRTFLFFYVMSMHLLVFFTTYHISHEVACQNHLPHEAFTQKMIEYDPVQADIALAKASIGKSH